MANRHRLALCCVDDNDTVIAVVPLSVEWSQDMMSDVRFPGTMTTEEGVHALVEDAVCGAVSPALKKLIPLCGSKDVE